MKLEMTLAFLEDRITYFKNANEYVRQKRAEGFDVKVEGDFNQKIIDWETGRRFVHELYTPLVANKYEKIVFLKTTIRQDIKTMIDMLGFNVSEKKKLPVTETTTQEIRSTESVLNFLHGCIKEIDALKD